MVKNRIYQIWEKGYLNIIIASVIYIYYGLQERLGFLRGDWDKEIAYFQYIKTSLTTFHSLPFFWWNKLNSTQWFWYPAVGHTSNFISNPETMLLSPLTPLIIFMDAIHYIKLIIIIHFLVGVIGMLRLRNRLRWNNLQFRTFSSLFLFSPIVIQHIACGYTPWFNLFLFPWLIYFVADRRLSISSLGVSGILSLILLQGGTHVFVWFAMFFMLYSIFCACFERDRIYLIRPLIVIIMVPLLSLVRIYSTAQAYGDFHQIFFPGYNPINFLSWALIPPIMVRPFYNYFFSKAWFGVPSYDGSIFWGLSLLMVVVLLTKYKTYRSITETNKLIKGNGLNYDSVLISSLVILTFSFHSFYELLIKTINTIIYIPFIDGVEKYPYRLAIPAFLGFTILVANFSENIWGTISTWVTIRTRLIHMLSSLANVLISLSLSFIIGTSLCLTTSVVFDRKILSILTNIVRNAYYDINSQWLSQMMQGKESRPLESYLTFVESGYVKLQIVMVVVLVFSFIIYLTLRDPPHELFTKKPPYAIYDIALTFPLIFSAAIWLSMAVSAPAINNTIQDVAAPRILTRPSLVNLKLKTIVTPQKLIIYPPENTRVIEYIMPDISSGDGKYFEVFSRNAKISKTNKSMSILTQGGGPIILKFKAKNYKYALYLTGLIWIVLITIFIANIALCKEKPNKPFIA